jgi:hypothetical protein
VGAERRKSGAKAPNGVRSPRNIHRA